MLFTEPVFLFAFLPAVLGLYFVTPGRLRNGLLLAASLLFYAWGEKLYVAVLLFSIVLNYLSGLAVGRAQQPGRRRLTMSAAVAANLLLLIIFKYAGFLVANLNGLLQLLKLHTLPVPAVRLPIGISFFTFMGISYVVDIYRRQQAPQGSPVVFALYITLFPHLIAGPIVRYSDIAAELIERRVSRPEFAEGIRRFVVGFGKKMLIANTVALTSDQIFSVPPDRLTFGAAWLGAVCYALQIYFDFSGYSDMAIGLARMFGFHFPENFNYPYVSQSITDFWRRWHISLSTWFRDYLFFPLGVRRSRRRVYLNLLVVFFLCGLWHGASWNFIVWGLYHGSFLVLERSGFGGWLQKRGGAFGHVYALLVIVVGWVFFRADSLTHAAAFLKVMAGGGHFVGGYQVGMYLNRGLLLALFAGALGCAPVVGWLRKRQQEFVAACERPRDAVAAVCLNLLGVCALGAIFLASAALSAAGTYNPFIYFRF